jgi:hypothetical protein
MVYVEGRSVNDPNQVVAGVLRRIDTSLSALSACVVQDRFSSAPHRLSHHSSTHLLRRCWTTQQFKTGECLPGCRLSFQMVPAIYEWITASPKRQVEKGLNAARSAIEVHTGLSGGNHHTQLVLIRATADL